MIHISGDLALERRARSDLRRLKERFKPQCREEHILLQVLPIEILAHHVDLPTYGMDDGSSGACRSAARLAS